jgi:hypothetical protein
MKTSFFLTFVIAAVASASAVAMSDNAARGFVRIFLPRTGINVR